MSDGVVARQASSANDNPLTPHILDSNLSLAVSPIDPNLIIGGYETFGRTDSHSRLVTSTDAGRTWLTTIFNGSYPGGLEVFKDSLVAFDSSGTGYYAALATGTFSTTYLVFTSTNGLSWGAPSAVALTDYSEYRYPADLTVDPRTPGSASYAGSVYFASPYFGNVDPYVFGIRLRYSRDRAATWSSDVQVSDPENTDSDKPSVKVASNGTVYAAFTEVLSGSIKNAPKLFLDRSTDGGQSWGEDRLITGAPIVPIGQPDDKNRELVLIASDACDQMHIDHFPTIGISPSNANEVYVIWNDGRWDATADLCGREGSRHSDIAFSRTTDAGVTWSSPVRLNDDPQGNGIDQWQPNLAVAPDGTVSVTWYDRRYSSNPYFYDTAYSQSTDGGLTWSPNRRVSDVSSDPTQLYDNKGVDDPGYRTGMAIGPDYVIPGWVDTRDGSELGLLYTDRGAIPASSPTASATPTVAPTVCTLSFSDVAPGSTFYPYVQCLACRGIVSGYVDGTFQPNNNVTRGQLAKIVSNSAGLIEPVSGQTFEDVASGSTFYTFTERLVMHGAMQGYACGSPGEPCINPGSRPYFRPSNNATRGQISKIVSQAAGFNNAPGSQIFEDVPPASTFYDYIQRLASRGYMNGYPCGAPGEPCVNPGGRPYFRPNNNATRGQSSKIVTNTFFPECSPAR